MAVEEDTSHTLRRLRVTTEIDPSALPRLLGLLQNLNLVPTRVVAECTVCTMHVQIDVVGVSDKSLSLVAGKIGQSPAVLNVYWHHL
jgi:hypothetical protein